MELYEATRGRRSIRRFKPDVVRVAGAVGLPEGVELVALAPLGYPDDEAKAPPRKAPGDFAHWERS